MRKTFVQFGMLLTVLSVFLLISCGPAPRSTSVFKPVNNIPRRVAVLHFYRPVQSMNLSSAPVVILKGNNREPVAEIPAGSYQSVVCEAGGNVFYSAVERNNKIVKLGEKSINVKIEGGIEYYIRVSSQGGVGGHNFAVVTKQEGRADISLCSPAPGVFALPVEKQLAAYREEQELPEDGGGTRSAEDVRIETAASEARTVISKEDLDTFGEYYALIIGINDYANIPKLETAISDAKVIGAILESSYRFNINLLLNATRADILMALNNYRKTLTEKDNLLIYYAGHGWLDEDADEGYWLPADAERDNSVNWIANATLTSELRAIAAKHVIVISDSCYSGKLTRGLNIVQRTPDYLRKMARKRTRVVMSSGGLEPVMDSSFDGTHSVFALSLIKTLSENMDVLDGTALFNEIRRPVMLNSDQTPEYGDIRKAGHEGGDFLFIHNFSIK